MKQDDRPTIRLKKSSYQPTKAELNERWRINPDLTPEDVVWILLKQVRIVRE